MRTATRRAGQSCPSRFAVVADAFEGHAQIALDVVVESFQRRDVEQSHARCRDGKLGQGAVDGIDAPQKSGQRLARARGSQDERVLPTLDWGPALRLRRRGYPERVLEPGACGSREAGQWIG